jgi:hypothetical protein
LFCPSFLVQLLTSSVPSLSPSPTLLSSLIHSAESIYLALFPLLQLFVSVLHPAVSKNEDAFLPLMVTSVYCALGLVWSWARLIWCGWGWLEDDDDEKKKVE